MPRSSTTHQRFFPNTAARHVEDVDAIQPRLGQHDVAPEKIAMAELVFMELPGHFSQPVNQLAPMSAQLVRSTNAD